MDHGGDSAGRRAALAWSHKEAIMKIKDTIALVTGANRGLGRALVSELLARGARRVYAAGRDLRAIPEDPRVVPLRLDVTDAAQVEAAAAAAADVRLLVNNAGSLASMSVLGSSREALQRDLDVNYHGALNVARAFAPALAAAPSGDAAIVNVLAIVSLASMPGIGGYSASKAAAWSLTQALRAELRAKGVRVHAAFPGPIDTDMTRGLELPKASAADVARGILDGVEAGQDDIAPDPMSADVLATFLRSPRELERSFAG
jgi:NAD(P)-dependent dehydrogenase (short-subunit alcohol dehydrogenase family)